MDTAAPAAASCRIHLDNISCHFLPCTQRARARLDISPARLFPKRAFPCDRTLRARFPTTLRKSPGRVPFRETNDKVVAFRESLSRIARDERQRDRNTERVKRKSLINGNVSPARRCETGESADCEGESRRGSIFFFLFS
jgi:hypothetical protein